MKQTEHLQYLINKLRTFLTLVTDRAMAGMTVETKPAFCPVVVRVTPPVRKRPLD